ncbi:MAG TPA: adenylate cyclase regulatory domain-containing protein [Solirubrobacteraceae bacterium]|nr:adenylate cyclase regulatory domain-containing protein [Solirubrobacteraceae bacterium]
MTRVDFLDDPRLYRDVHGDDARAARRALLEELLHAGVSEQRLVEAVKDDHLAVLPAELVLGGKTPYTLTEVARAADLTPAFLRKLLLAMGRPNPRRGERAFTKGDIEEARIIRALLDAGLPRDGVLHVARVMGQSMTNLALAIQELVARAFLKRGDTEHELALRYEQAAEQLAPLVAPLLGHELIVHVRELVRRDAVTQAERESGTIEGTRTIAAAFVDLVDFTKLGGELPPGELGEVAERLTTIATNVVTAPVQLVKTIGDAVLLVSPEVGPLLDAIAEIMRKAEAEGPGFPQLRTGVAYGPAVSRTGDWFGAPVNLASRLTAAARPGTVVVDAAAREAAGDGYVWSRSRRKVLKGAGWVKHFRFYPDEEP